MMAGISLLVGPESSTDHVVSCGIQRNPLAEEFLKRELVRVNAEARVARVIMGNIRMVLGERVHHVTVEQMARMDNLIGDHTAMNRLHGHLMVHHDGFGQSFMKCLLLLKMLGSAEKVAPAMKIPEDAKDSPYRQLLDIFTVTFALLAGCDFDARSTTAA